MYPRFAPHVDVGRMESAAWSFRADRCATPAVFAAAAGSSPARFAARPVRRRLRVRDGRPVIWLDFPYREEPLRYDGSETPAPADVQTYRWTAGRDGRRSSSSSTTATGATRSADVVLGAGKSPRLGLGRGGGRARGVGALPLALPAGPAAADRDGGFDRDAFGERGDRDAMHVSWVSGVPYAYALLRHGRASATTTTCARPSRCSTTSPPT